MLHMVQSGDYILQEGEQLTSTSKFYLVQSGTVECFKQFNVGIHLPTAAVALHLKRISYAVQHPCRAAFAWLLSAVAVVLAATTMASCSGTNDTASVHVVIVTNH